MSWEQRSIPGRREEEGRSDCIREKNRMASSLSCDVCFEQFTGGTRWVEMVIMNKDIGWNGDIVSSFFLAINIQDFRHSNKKTMEYL